MAHSVLDNYLDYEVVIGIEIHVQLNTKSKIFCGCANTVAQSPNTYICPVCCGYPGVLPVLNSAVLKSALLAGLATNCTIAPISEFARKHYFYPDLPKNYQITQADIPIALNGSVEIKLEDGSFKTIRIMRIHIEEDAGKNIHSALSNESFVDLNRTGTPLLEIVTQPDIASTYEARTYLKTVRSIVQYLKICSGNMEEGAFRADTNISVRKKGAEKLGTRCELKNINSFKFISDAIEYEIERQITQLESGKKIVQETRLWDTKEHKTISMRSKEEAADYRYMIDPDLPKIVITDEHLLSIKNELPELPAQKFERFIKEYALTPYEAEIMINDLLLADYYEEAYAYKPSKLLINWVLRDIMGLLKEYMILDQLKITPKKLAILVGLIESSTINNRAAQELFLAVVDTGKEPEILVKELGLEQMGDSQELEKIIQEIIAINQKQTADYRSGKDKLWGFFVGQAMQKTKGKGNPQLIEELLKKHL